MLAIKEFNGKLYYYCKLYQLFHDKKLVSNNSDKNLTQKDNYPIKVSIILSKYK
jgi:hypothetical protein